MRLTAGTFKEAYPGQYKDRPYFSIRRLKSGAIVIELGWIWFHIEWQIRNLYRFIQIHGNSLRLPILRPILLRFLVWLYCSGRAHKNRTLYNIWDIVIGEVMY